MKVRVTKRQIQENYATIISVGYCDLQTLLKYEVPHFYTASNTNGWGADIYEIDGVAIVTGYAPFGNYKDFDLCKYYEKRAQELANTEFDTPEFHKTLIRGLIENIRRKK